MSFIYLVFIATSTVLSASGREIPKNNIVLPK